MYQFQLKFSKSFDNGATRCVFHTNGDVTSHEEWHKRVAAGVGAMLAENNVHPLLLLQEYFRALGEEKVEQFGWEKLAALADKLDIWDGAYDLDDCVQITLDMKKWSQQEGD